MRRTDPQPPDTADLAAWRRAVRALPIEIRGALAPEFAAAVIRAVRVAERDAALVRMAIGRTGSASALADQVHRDLARYAASAWRFDHDRDRPHDARNTAAHLALRMSGGRVPAARSLRLLFSLAEIRVEIANIAPQNEAKHGGNIGHR